MTDSNANNADLSALRINRDRKSDHPGRWKRWLHLLWLLVPIILYFAYHLTIAKITPAIKVQTAQVQLLSGSEASVELVATGYVVAQIKANVASKGTGRLRALNVVEGDSVKLGQIIAELENDDIMAELELARANLKRARADSVEADLNLGRQKRLYEAAHSTQEILDAATAAYDRATANMDAMRASIRAVEVALENTIIRAPFDGTVLSKQADVGEIVAPFASSASSKGAVVILANMKSLQVEADVSESNIDKVKINQPCEIILDAYPGIEYPGHVAKIVPTADRSRATVLTKINFNSIDNRVLPEMSARVNFLPLTGEPSGEIKPVMTIPKSALTNRDNQAVVFLVTGDKVNALPVQAGRQLGEHVEIIFGLKTGDEIVLSPPGGLRSGDKIEIAK